MRDVEAELVTALRILPAIRAAGVDIVDVEKHLPYAAVSTLPSQEAERTWGCLLYTSPSPRDVEEARMPSSA